MKELEIVSLYDLSHTLAAPYLSRFTYPWEALAGLSDFIVELGRSLPAEEYEEIGENIWAAKSAVIAPTASLTGPVIIGKNSQVRHCAFLRGSILVGETCVVGNSTELKNVILFDHVQVPHYNYVGDSILGYHSHMGAGSITSNVKSDKQPVVIKAGEVQIETGRKKSGRNARGLCGGRMRQCHESGRGRRETYKHISPFHGQRIYPRRRHL